MARPDTSRDVAHLLGVVVAVVVVATLYYAKVVLIPFALAVLLTFVLTPFVKMLEHIRLGRVLSTLSVVLLAVVAVSALGWTVGLQFTQAMNELPNYRTNIKNKVDSLHWTRNQTINNASDTMNEISKELAAPPARNAAGEPRSSYTASRQRPLPVEVVKPPSLPLESVQSVLGLIASFGIVVVFTFFMLVRRENLRNRFISLAGQGRLHAMTQAMDEAAARVSRYLRLQLIVNICYGVFIGTCLHFIGVPSALLWGVLVAILRFLPYIGPPLGAILPLLLSLAVFNGWSRPLMTLGVFVVTEIIVSNLIEPWLYGAYTGISSLAVLVAAIFWTAIWGPIGLLLSTPLTLCVVVIGRYVPRLSFLPVLLGDDPVLAPESHFYQRLLALDQDESRVILVEYLKNKSLEELYDSVLIPALNLAERDRHRNRIDADTGKFIAHSTKQLIQELYEIDTAHSGGKGVEQSRPSIDAESSGSLELRTPPKNHALKVICIPARDEADEIAGRMLAQLLEKAGLRASCLPCQRASEMVLRAAQALPDVVCISALPPFALVHAKSLYHKLRAQAPGVRVFIGFWNYPGDVERIAARLQLAEGSKMAITLSEVVSDLASPAEAAPTVLSEFRA
jgi:predicted PurR-regulated permease PerM/methylmalonyl-CoA mutase cobalamin-binding subunit